MVLSCILIGRCWKWIWVIITSYYYVYTNWYVALYLNNILFNLWAWGKVFQYFQVKKHKTKWSHNLWVLKFQVFFDFVKSKWDVQHVLCVLYVAWYRVLQMVVLSERIHYIIWQCIKLKVKGWAYGCDLITRVHAFTVQGQISSVT